MSKKLKVEGRTLEELLKDAGFSNVRKINERVIHASDAEDFGKAHAAFLQAADKHPALIGCSRFNAVPQPVLIVHVNVDATSSSHLTQPEKRGEDTASTEETD